MFCLFPFPATDSCLESNEKVNPLKEGEETHRRFCESVNAGKWFGLWWVGFGCGLFYPLEFVFCLGVGNVLTGYSG